MPTREAACSCGQLRLQVTGEPMALSICHCLACQRRTGSAFGMQAGFTAEQVSIGGRHTEYARTSDEQDRKVHVFHFCPDCGGTVFYTEPDEPDLVVLMTGAFADPSFPRPTRSGYTNRMHHWLVLPPEIETDAAWSSLQPLYEAGEYAEVAERAPQLIAANPENAGLLYNVACCESLAGRTEDAIGHLQRAIARNEEFRELAAEDADLDPVREQPAFKELVGWSAGAGST